MITEGNFEIQSSGSYVITYDAASGGGHFEFNTFGKGNEGKSEYQVRASNGGADMYVWQDIGFHHRRRRSDVKPWQPISSIYLEKGSYYGRMTRVDWTQCPNFQLLIEEQNSVYARPLLSGVVAVTDVSRNDLGAGGQSERDWDDDWHRYRWGSYSSSPATSRGKSNEIVVTDAYGTLVGKHTIDRVNLTADELYGFFSIDKRSPSLPEGTSQKYMIMILRTTVVLPAAGRTSFATSRITPRMKLIPNGGRGSPAPTITELKLELMEGQLSRKVVGVVHLLPS
jgi:hypothetical protein